MTFHFALSRIKDYCTCFVLYIAAIEASVTLVVAYFFAAVVDFYVVKQMFSPEINAITRINIVIETEIFCDNQLE